MEQWPNSSGEQVTEMGVGYANSSNSPSPAAMQARPRPDRGGSGQSPATALTWQHTNVYAGGKLLGTYDKDGLHFYLDDPLGTRRAQTDYAGVLEQNCVSLPFGDALSCAAQPGSNYSASLIAPTEQHFTGKERDSESGNDYFGARYYASSMGRFLSPDSSAKEEPVPYAKLDDPQTLNLYAYVRNHPTDLTDADGHQDAPDVTITINRDTTTNKSTTGTVHMSGGNGRFLDGYSLELPKAGEDTNPNRVKGRIDPGTYDAEYKATLKNGTPALYELTQSETKYGIGNDRTSIYGHVGNTAVNSEGCQLFGTTRGVNSIQNSKAFIEDGRSMFSQVAKDNGKSLQDLTIRVVIPPTSSDEVDTPLTAPLSPGGGQSSGSGSSSGPAAGSGGGGSPS